MDEYSSFTYSNFMQAVGERRLQRFYFPILIGLFFFYLGTFIWLTPMAAAIPGIIGGWFYHRRGALITSGFVTGINLILIRLGLYGTGHFSLNLAASFLVGHLLIVGTALAVGYFREEIERQHRIDKRVQARERHLILINMATKEILEGGDLDNIYYNLITRLTNLVTADHGCLLVWDDKLQNISLTVTTYQADQPQSSLPLHSEEIAIIRSLLEDRHIVFIDNTEQSMQYAKICTFNTIRESTRAAILIPLATHDFRFGVVALAFVTPLSLDREEISYIELTSQQITLALRSIQQEQQIEKQLQVDQALLSIGRALGENEHIGTGKVLQLIVDAARELMPHAEKSVIHLLDEEAQTLFAHAVSGFEEHEDAFRRIGMRLGEGIAGQAISDGVSINIGDILKHPGFIPATANPNYRSLLVVPVQSGMKPIGTISIQSTQYNAFKERDAEILKALSIQAAVAIENTRLFETTQQQLKEVNILYQISRALAISIDAEQLIHDTTELLQLNFEYYYAQVFLIEPDTHNLILKHGSGEIGKKLVQNGHYLPAGEGVVGHVAATGLPFVTNNVDDVVFFKRNPLLQET